MEHCKILILFVALGFSCYELKGQKIRDINANQIEVLKKSNSRTIWENPNVPDTTRFKAINEYYEKNTFSQPDSVIPVTEFHFELAKLKENSEEKIKALSERSYAFFIKDNVKKAEEILRDAIKIQTSLNDSIALAVLFTNLASIYRAQGDFIETIRTYNKALTILEAKGDAKTKAAVLGNLGLVYYDLTNFEIAEFYFQKSLANYAALELQDKIGYISLYLGAIDYEKGDYTKSIALAEKALRIFENNNNQFSKADCHALLGKSYQKLNKRDKAISEINKSIAINQELNNTTRVIQDKILLAGHYFDYDLQKSAQIGEEVLAVIDYTADKKSKSDLYYLLYRCYKKFNKTELAHSMYEKFVVYNDSVVKTQSNLELLKEAVKQEYYVEISKNKQSYESFERELKFAQSMKIGLIVLIFLIVFFLLVYYYGRKIRLDKSKRIELIEEINKLKSNTAAADSLAANNFELNRMRIEKRINRKLNETDWNVLNVLLQNPVISNKDLAEKVFLSVDGIGSCLRRMYEYFEIEDSKYKKTDLIRKVIQLSNKDQ